MRLLTLTLACLIASTLAGCDSMTDLQTQRRKERDRHLILDERATEWYSQHDAGIWNNSRYEPRPSMRRVLNGTDHCYSHTL
mgnify:CR=1 FL=1